ncbi:MAG: DUF2818 family protein [Burkholderiales bacterium]
MSQSASVWLVILAALLAANLPFMNERVLAMFPLARRKPLGLRLVEMVLLYFAVGAVALALEQRAGRIFPQGWEFYAITGTLFVTFAFPGFVWRYLFKHRD